MQENTLTEKYKDIPAELTYWQACGRVLSGLGRAIRERPMKAVPLVLFSAALLLVGGPVMAIASPALGVLWAGRKMQTAGTQKGILKALLGEQEIAVAQASELLAHAEDSKKQPALRQKFMKEAVFYSYFFETLSGDLNLSAQARDVAGKIEGEIAAESPTALDCLHLVNRMNAAQAGTLAVVFNDARKAVKRDPQSGFVGQFEQAAQAHIKEAAFGGHADVFDLGLITDMRNYLGRLDA